MVVGDPYSNDPNDETDAMKRKRGALHQAVLLYSVYLAAEILDVPATKIKLP